MEIKHTHCKLCGRLIPAANEICDECGEELDENWYQSNADFIVGGEEN